MSSFFDMMSAAIYAILVQNLVFSGGYGISEAVRMAAKPRRLASSAGMIVWFSTATAVVCRLLDFKEVIARQNNACQNFLKAQFGTSGGRANWKWDCANWEKEWDQPSFNGFSIRSFKFPAGTSKLDFVAAIEPNRPIETSAVLVLPLCDVDARYDLRTILFGLNCNPFVQ